jgi:hypothetical protein
LEMARLGLCSRTNMLGNVIFALDPEFVSITGKAALERNFHVNTGKAALRRNCDFNICKLALGRNFDVNKRNKKRTP